MTDADLSVDVFNSITEILVNKHYKGDPAAVQGYVNYPTPVGNPNWERFYYGDNAQRLSVIKRKYDPRNVFTLPIQIAPAADDEL